MHAGAHEHLSNVWFQLKYQEDQLMVDASDGHEIFASAKAVNVAVVTTIKYLGVKLSFDKKTTLRACKDHLKSAIGMI